MAVRTDASADTMANYLVDGYWTATGNIAHEWTGSSVTYSFGSSWMQATENAVSDILSLLSSVIDLSFVEVASGAQITYVEGSNGGANTNGTWYSDGSIITQTVSIDTNINGWTETQIQTMSEYGWKTVIHETCHALGLGHSGNYNLTGSYSTSAIYNQDTQQYTVMSYWDETSYGGADFGSNYATTPMLYDVCALQKIYGANTTTNAGDTVYGFNSTAGYDAYNFTINSDPIVCIYDPGGINTLDLSGYATGSYVNLTPGTYSSIDGMTYNLSIAYNTDIQTAIGGSGGDTILGSSSNNDLTGNAGDDRLYGEEGADTLRGGSGLDTLVGGSGYDVFYGTVAELNGDVINDFAGGDTIVVSGSNLASLNGTAVTGTLDLGGGNSLSILGISGTYTWTATYSGGVTTLSVTGLPEAPICFLRGTRILTDKGEMPIEKIKRGTLIRTARGTFEPVLWVGKRVIRVSLMTEEEHATHYPVLIRKGAIGENLPSRDIYLSAMHAVCLNGSLVMAANLINGVSVLPYLDLERIEYYNIEFENHEIIFAEGMTVESYLDIGNRIDFDNCDAYYQQHGRIARAKPRIYATLASKGEIEEMWRLVNLRAQFKFSDIDFSVPAYVLEGSPAAERFAIPAA